MGDFSIQEIRAAVKRLLLKACYTYMDYVIAIPTYKRPIDCQRTLRLVNKQGLLKITTLFVVESEYDAYVEECAKAKLVPSKIVIGKLGLAAQRQFIYDYYDEDTCIFMMDDDIEDIIDADKNSALPDMNHYIKYGFQLCKKNNCRLLGLYPDCKPFFMKETWSSDLKICVNSAYGIIKSGINPYKIDDENLGLYQDLYRSCAYFEADGKVIRLNFISPKTDTREIVEDQSNLLTSALLLKSKYPQWVTLYTHTKDGVPEIRIRSKSTVKKPGIINSAIKNIIHMKALCPSIFATLKNHLKEKPPKNSDNRKNSGYGRTQAYGILNRVWMGGNAGIGLASNNDINPHIWDEGYRISKLIVPKSINWTTIMVNMNYEAAPHLDKNNTGPSLVVAFGDYTGGELVTIDLSGNETPYNIRYRPVIMDASVITHYVKPIKSGTRYSIIFFRSKIPKFVSEKYGENLTVDELIALIPAKKPGETNYDVRIA